MSLWPRRSRPPADDLGGNSSEPQRPADVAAREPDLTSPVPTLISPGLAVLSDEFRNKPFGSRGEVFAPPAGDIPAPTLERPAIPPPPWVGVDGNLDLGSPPPPVTGGELPAVVGVVPYNPEPWRPLAPTHTPLLPPKIPPPDWRAEELEAARRDRAEQNHEPQEAPRIPTYPGPSRRPS